MKIIIAPDSFKGSLNSLEAANSIRAGILAAADNVEILILPIADGGEGTLDAIVPEQNRKFAIVTSTLGEQINAAYGVNGDTAIIEMSRAAGLTLVTPEKRDIEQATTYGVGQLIAQALDNGCKRILLTVGGSGTNDGGTGMFEALGAVFYDDNGKLIHGNGSALAKIKKIDITNLDKRLLDCEIVIATDVTNPLTGVNGATRIYGPQKGALGEVQDKLEAGMVQYAKLLYESTGIDVAAIPGSGAGGGIAAPLLAYTNARIVSGIDAVLDALEFDRKLVETDFVITGEGRVDSQSLYGKAISGIAAAAAKQNVPVFVFAGSLGDGLDGLYDIGVKGIFSIIESPCTLEYAMENAQQLLFKTAYRWAKMFL